MNEIAIGILQANLALLVIVCGMALTIYVLVWVAINMRRWFDRMQKKRRGREQEHETT